MPGSLRTTPQHIAAVGLTVDGREISEQDIDDIVATYNPKVYGARINLDHYGNWGGWAAELQGVELNGCMLGDVISVAKGEAEDGTAVLTAILCPNASLLKLNQADQAVYYSIELNRNFMDTDKTYLTGLAMTDYPASTRTTRASFSAKDKPNSDQPNEQPSEQVKKFSLAIEPKQSMFKNLFTHLLAAKKDDEMKPSELASAITEALSEPFKQITSALDNNAAETKALADNFSKLSPPGDETDTGATVEDKSGKENQAFSDLEEKNKDLQTQITQLTADFAKAKVTQADSTTVTDDDQTGESNKFGEDFL